MNCHQALLATLYRKIAAISKGGKEQNRKAFLIVIYARMLWLISDTWKLKQRKKKSTKRPKFDHHESQQAAFAETRVSERNSTNSYCAHDATELPLLYGCRFAAQVFHGLYDEVMSTSARGHGLMLRVQQLEAELPLLEKDSCQRDYLYVASNRGGFSIKCKFLFCCLSFTTSQFSGKKSKISLLFSLICKSHN